MVYMHCTALESVWSEPFLCHIRQDEKLTGRIVQCRGADNHLFAACLLNTCVLSTVPHDSRPFILDCLC